MSGLEEEATSELEREPSENPYIWAPRATYRRDLLVLSSQIKILEEAIHQTEAKLDTAIRPLDDRLKTLTNQEHRLLGSLQEASSMAMFLRSVLRNAWMGAGESSIRGQLERIQSSTRLNVEVINAGIEGLVHILESRASKMATEAAERLKPGGNLAIHLDPFGEQYQFVGQAFVSWAASLDDWDAAGVSQWLDFMIDNQEEALEWRQEDKKRRREKKEWEDEQLLTKLWPVS